MDCARNAKMSSAKGLQKSNGSNQAKIEADKMPASEHRRLDDKPPSSTSSSRQTSFMDPKPLPEHVKKFIQRKNAWKSETEKKAARKRKQDFANKVGWQKRFGRHRHQHQADRERQLLNYMQGLPLDYDEDDGSEYY